MFQKTILIIITFSAVIVISGCRGFDKGLSEYGRASRKYNSNNAYNRNQRKSYVDPGTSKMILDHCNQSR